MSRAYFVVFVFSVIDECEMDTEIPDYNLILYTLVIFHLFYF